MNGSKVLLAGIAAMLPVAALGAAQPAREECAQAFAPPQTGLILTRELRRPLPGGKEVVSRRSYEITFTRVGTGFRVDGRLVGVEVEAPPALQALAAIERNRADSGLFPIMLDAHGQIVAPSAPQDKEAVGKASETVGLWLAKSDLAEADRQAAQAFLTQMKSSSATTGSVWPRDLFHPAAGQTSETSHFALPDGDQGSITVATRARMQSEGGLLESIERTVTTRLGASERTTRETWALTLARSNR